MSAKPLISDHSKLGVLGRISALHRLPPKNSPSHCPRPPTHPAPLAGGTAGLGLQGSHQA